MVYIYYSIDHTYMHTYTFVHTHPLRLIGVSLKHGSVKPMFLGWVRDEVVDMDDFSTVSSTLGGRRRPSERKPQTVNIRILVLRNVKT